MKSPVILIVDEHEHIRSILQRLFENYGVETASSVQEALDAFNVHHHRLVITDLEMPNGNGLSLATAIKVLHPTTIIVLLTGAIIDAEELQRHKVDYYVPKPFDVETLHALVVKCLS